MTVAYIEKKGGEFLNVNAFTAYEGFMNLGVEVRGFEFDRMGDLPLTCETIVHGYIRSVRRAYDMLGVVEKPLPSIPPELTAFAGRKTWETTLGEIRRLDAPVFIKPLRDQKRFTGYVRGSDVEDINRSAHLDDGFPVLASDVVLFVSEWRCFILDGRCIGARPYRGDHLTPIPQLSRVERCIQAWGRGIPAACSIDLGLTDDGRTLLVEVNRASALGAYGLAPTLYAQMIEAAWDEAVGLRDPLVGQHGHAGPQPHSSGDVESPPSRARRGP